MRSIAEGMSEIVTIGLDPHPGSHTASALNGYGRQLDEITVANEEAGWDLLMGWSRRFPRRRWAIEGPGNRFARAIVGRLMKAGEELHPITPSMTAQYRGRNSRGKDDEIDATNAARVLLANDNIPTYDPMPYEADLKELTRSYKRISTELKAIRMSATDMASIEAKKTLAKVAAVLEKAAKDLKGQMEKLVRPIAPTLIGLRGVGPVVAATVLAEAGRIFRFPGQDHFASYAGAAPIRWSSGAQETIRVNPRGNRRLNWAAHIIALNRLRTDQKTREYRDKKLAEGKTMREVLRLLKTYICRELYRVLLAEQMRVEGH